MVLSTFLLDTVHTSLRILLQFQFIYLLFCCLYDEFSTIILRRCPKPIFRSFRTSPNHRNQLLKWLHLKSCLKTLPAQIWRLTGWNCNGYWTILCVKVCSLSIFCSHKCFSHTNCYKNARLCWSVVYVVNVSFFLHLQFLPIHRT